MRRLEISQSGYASTDSSPRGIYVTLEGSVSIDLAFFGVFSLVSFSSQGSVIAMLGSVGVPFKFSSWSARDSSTAGSGMTRFCIDPN